MLTGAAALGLLVLGSPEEEAPVVEYINKPLGVAHDQDMPARVTVRMAGSHEVVFSELLLPNGIGTIFFQPNTIDCRDLQLEARIGTKDWQRVSGTMCDDNHEIPDFTLIASGSHTPNISENIVE